MTSLILRKSPKVESVDNMSGRHIDESKNVTKAHILVDDIEKPELSEEKQHHLKKVRRIKAGCNVTATDGRGEGLGAYFGLLGNRSRMPTHFIIQKNASLLLLSR